MDKLTTLATMEQLDALERMELQRLSEKTERNRMEKERVMLADALVQERSRRRKAAQRHREELNGMVAFIGVMVGLVVMIACALSGAAWTVILAILLMLSLMWKVGWI